MEVIITKSQYVKLLTEEKKNEIESTFDDSKSFVKRVVGDIKKQHGMDFSFALTWGPTIGGFVGPISRYLEGTYPSLSQSDITLLTFGIIMTFFSSNKEKINKVLTLIKEKGLVTFFDRALRKSFDLKESFIDFIESLNVTFSRTSNMLSYTFLVPLVPMLKELSDMDLDPSQVAMIAKGIASYTGTAVSSTIIFELVKKIIKRFRS
jgi:hypothetical protein